MACASQQPVMISTSSHIITRYWRPDPGRSSAVATGPRPTAATDVAIGDRAFARVEKARAQLSVLEEQLAEPARLIAEGEVVAFPTETVYGLGGDATNTEAIGKIYSAKGRPSDNPLIVHIATREQLSRIAKEVPEVALPLMDAFWPGPLTLVLPATPNVSPRVTAGLTTVAVRMPNHPIALALIRKSDIPIAAPSANASGRPSPTCARHVADDLDGKIAGIIDGALVRTRLRDAIRELNAASSKDRDSATTAEAASDDAYESECVFGVESTVVDISQFCTSSIKIEHPKVYILRPGAVTKSMLESVLPECQIEYDPTLPIDPSLLPSKEQNVESKTQKPDSNATVSDDQSGAEAALRHELATRANAAEGEVERTAVGTSATPMAPGMKYVHYAPRAPLYLVLGSAGSGSSGSTPQASASTAIWEQVRSASQAHIGLLLTSESFAELGLNKLASQHGVPLPSLTNPRLVFAVDPSGAEIRLLTEESPNPEPGWKKVTALYCGSRQDFTTVSVRLYDALREFDTCQVEIIFAESLDSHDGGAAVMNRLLKAAGGKILRS